MIKEVVPYMDKGALKEPKEMYQQLTGRRSTLQQYIQARKKLFGGK